MPNFTERNAFPQDASAVTKSDSTELALKGLYVGTGGDVALLLTYATAAVTFKNVSSGSFMPLSIKKVMSTNTTASDMVGLG